MHFNSRSWLLHCLPRLFPHFFSPLNLPILLNLAPFLCSSSFNPSMLSHSHEISMRKYHICYWKSYPFTAASIRIFPFQLLRSIKINIHFSNTLSKKTFWLCTKRGFVAITYKFVGNHLSMVLCLVLNYVPPVILVQVIIRPSFETSTKETAVIESLDLQKKNMIKTPFSSNTQN